MTRTQKAEKIIRNHVLWAIGISSVPIPFLDVIGVTAIHMDMLRQLTSLYDVDFDQHKGKAMITSLVSTTLAGSISAGTHIVGERGRAISRISTIILQGAVTYAIGQLFLSAFDQGAKSLFDVNIDDSGEFFEDAVEKGREYVENLIREKE